MASNGNQRGMSLVELMIAMVLGLLILGAVVAIFTGAAGSFALNRELDRSQENLRFAVTLLTHELRQATPIRVDDDDFLSPVEVSPDAQTGTQAITIRYPVVNTGEAVHCNGDDVSGGTVLEKTFSALQDAAGTLRCSSAVLGGTVMEEDVAYGIRSIRIDRWLESDVAPNPYALNERELMSDMVTDDGLGLVGVRFLVEHDHVNAQTQTFVVTTALRNAVLQWFTIVPP